jgi:hypothetical protein
MSIALDCFDWHGFESPPDPHDEVFVRYGPDVILAGIFRGGFLYAPYGETASLMRVTGPAEAWAPVLETPTPKMGHVV